MELSADDHTELVSRLGSLRELAAALSDVFDDARAEAGAREMLASIDRMLAILEGRRE
ncbi:MAG TPA: hypothetical protein VE615_03295 [Gaiellaceae bacterium]|jgi:hypothetical protein|nr:hypothetical protein [Gaiellaceae bacterium]